MGTAHGVEGYAGPTTVAIKQLRANAEESERMEFIAEMNIMKQVAFFFLWATTSVKNLSANDH